MRVGGAVDWGVGVSWRIGSGVRARVGVGIGEICIVGSGVGVADPMNMIVSVAEGVGKGLFSGGGAGAGGPPSQAATIALRKIIRAVVRTSLNRDCSFGIDVKNHTLIVGVCQLVFFFIDISLTFLRLCGASVMKFKIGV